MRRSVDQYDSEGRLITGYDYINQAWVRAGSYLDCGHPAEGEWMPATESIFEGCSCYGRAHTGEQPPIGCRYMAPGVMERFLLRLWQAHTEGMLDPRQVRILRAWTDRELSHA
jgi:hypothetical protein